MKPHYSLSPFIPITHQDSVSPPLCISNLIIRSMIQIETVAALSDDGQTLLRKNNFARLKVDDDDINIKLFYSQILPGLCLQRAVIVD